MQEFTGFEYIKLDIANNFGLDKENFEPRLQWVDEHMAVLEEKVDEADEPVLYLKAVMALRDAQKGIASGHLIGFDACSSGLQIMSCLIGCEVTANNTGLIDPTVRADMYTLTTEKMNELLKELGIQVKTLRKHVKAAQMTHFYGSRAKPQEIFGEGTPELMMFYRAQHLVAPGACEVMDDMLSLWDRDATEHSWVLPDGFNAKVKVTYPVKLRVEVDELDHTTFTHQFMENISTNQHQDNTGEEVKDGVSLAAKFVG